MPEFNYSDKQIEALFRGIWSGAINIYKLPKNLYKTTYNYLNEAFDPTIDRELLQHLRNNVYMFSGAKTFNQVRDMQALLTEDNVKLDYKTFRDRVKATYTNYNAGYLETEYVTAVTAGSNAITWRETWRDRKLFDRLRYVAINDANTSEICKRLDGTIAATTDPFWRIHTPPNHFNCRCHIEKLSVYDDDKVTPPGTMSDITAFTDKHMQPAFRFNSGITQTAFSKSHPYFQVPKKYIPWAKKNFGLAIPRD